MEQEKTMVLDVNLLADQIKHHRKKIGLSQGKLAESLGTSQKSVSRYEKAQRLPSEGMLSKMADLFELSLEDFLKPTWNIEVKRARFPKLDKVKVGKRIHTIRKEHRLSLEKFGVLLTIEVRKNVVRRWEMGQNLPDIERLLNIAMLGNVSVEFILYGRKKLMSKSGVREKFPELSPIHLGLRLRKIRVDMGLEREEFGQMFEPVIRKWSADRYENGNDIPLSERLIQYAILGKVSINFLIYGTE
jgi:transcriptional regulator with XRE-family HTH domain